MYRTHSDLSPVLQGVFSVTFPHQDVYLVAKIDKVLQGGISACVDPYVKDYDNPKVCGIESAGIYDLTNEKRPFLFY